MSRRTLAVLATLLGFAGASHADEPLSAYDPPLGPALRERLAAADAAAGAALFERRCSQCHDAARDGRHAKGPNLWNVMGRKAASSPGFDYSPAMQKVGRVWSFATLDYFLADTARAVPGKAMDLPGIADERQRANLLAHLRTLNDAPPPLP